MCSTQTESWLYVFTMYIRKDNCDNKHDFTITPLLYDKVKYNTQRAVIERVSNGVSQEWSDVIMLQNKAVDICDNMAGLFNCELKRIQSLNDTRCHEPGSWVVKFEINRSTGFQCDRVLYQIIPVLSEGKRHLRLQQEEAIRNVKNECGLDYNFIIPMSCHIANITRVLREILDVYERSYNILLHA